MLNEAYTVKYHYNSAEKLADALSLSLFVSPCSFVFAVSTQQFKNVTELGHIQLNELQGTATNLADSVSFLVQNYQLHQRKFEKVLIALLDTEFVTIPQAYAGEEFIKPLLKFAIGDEELKTVKKHSIHALQFCFTAAVELVHYLERTFPNAAVRHAGAVSIQLLLNHHTLKACNLFLNVHDGFIELAAKNKNDLVFYNIFNYSTNEDILYYLLFMMEQFNFDPLYSRLAFAGCRAADDDLLKSIRRYIRQVDLCVPDPSIHLTGNLQQQPGHYYFTLLNQHLCEL